MAPSADNSSDTPRVQTQKSATRPAMAWLTMPLRSARQVVQAFYDQGLGALMPLVLVLLVLAAILSMLTLAGPIIPFIYPLF